MAEFATWAVLSRTLRIPLYDRQQRQHLWRPHPTLLAGDFSALVVGFGRIGEAVGAALKRLGMRVTGVRMEPAPPVGAADRIVGLKDLATALGEADFVLLTLPKTAVTNGLFDAAMIERMKPGATLINLSRGGIVEEAALCRALSEGRIAGAVLDVTEEEPLPSDDPLWDAPNLVMTPHVSADIDRWQAYAAETFAENLDRWLSGRPVLNLCDPRRGY
jgi:phosphoglycerate dehydrogenase-like enzyme